MRDSFLFYRSFFEAVEDLPPDEFKACVLSVANYALNDQDEEPEGVAKIFYKMAKPQIDANNKKYENGCKGGQFGKLGGAPKGNQNAKKTTPKQPQNNPKTTPNDNVNENVNDNVLYNTRRKWGGIQTGYDFQQLEREVGIK